MATADEILQQARAGGLNPFTGQTTNPSSFAATTQADYQASLDRRPQAVAPVVGGIKALQNFTPREQALQANGMSLEQIKALREQNGITADSNQLTSGSIRQSPGLSTFDEALQQIQSQFQQGLTPQEQAQIKADVAAQFAPRIREQERVNQLRESLFGAQAAASGASAFGATTPGAGMLERTGQLNVAQRSADLMNELSRLQSAEENARIAAAQSVNFKQKEDFIQMANQLRDQQLQELDLFARQGAASRSEQRDIGEQQRAAAQDVLGRIEQLSPEEISGLGNLAQIEKDAGLPLGYIKGYMNSRKQAEVAASAKPDLQVVQSGGGIWTFDKNTGEYTTFLEPISKTTPPGGPQAPPTPPETTQINPVVEAATALNQLKQEGGFNDFYYGIELRGLAEDFGIAPGSPEFNQLQSVLNQELSRLEGGTGGEFDASSASDFQTESPTVIDRLGGLGVLEGKVPQFRGGGTQIFKGNTATFNLPF